MITLLAFSSCKKVYTCYCKNFTTGVYVEVDTKEKTTKKKAIVYCESGNAFVPQGFSCELE